MTVWTDLLARASGWPRRIRGSRSPRWPRWRSASRPTRWCSRSSTACCCGTCRSTRPTASWTSPSSTGDNARNPISSASYPDVRDWNQMARTFEGIAGADERTMNLSDEAHPAERFRGAFVSANAFGLIGQRPLLGRDFRAEDDREGAAPVVMLGHAVWQRRYQGDPAIVGRTIRVNGVPSTVIGVMPEEFGFPQRLQRVAAAGAAAARDAHDRGARGVRRVRPAAAGVTLEQAAADLGSVIAALAAQYPDTNRRPRAARARCSAAASAGPSVPAAGGADRARSLSCCSSPARTWRTCCCRAPRRARAKCRCACRSAPAAGASSASS